MPSVVFAQDTVRGVFSIKYNKFERDVIVLFKEGKVYIPLLEIMSFLKIYSVNNRESKIISGYLGSEDKAFYINIANYEVINVNQETSLVSADSIIVKDLDMFLRPSIMANLFNLEISESYYDLKAFITSESDLPIKEDYQRQFKKEQSNHYMGEDEFAPLLFDRDFKIIDGGILNYKLGSNNSERYSIYSFTGDLGLQLLGGDLSINSYYNYNNQNNRKYQSHRYGWELPFNENKYISEIRIGNVASNSLNFGSFGSIRNKYSALKGVSITNRSYRSKKEFTKFSFFDYAEPFSQIELHVNNKLIKSEKLGADGYYYFDIPISYGNSIIETKIFEPSGRRVSKQENIQIPGAMLKPGEIRYAFSAGEDEHQQQKILDGLVEMGITDFFSFGGSNVYNVTENENILIANLNTRLIGGLTGAFSASKDNFYRIMTSFNEREIGNYEFSYTKYKKNAPLNGSNLDEEYQFRAYLPQNSWFPFSLRIRSEINKRSDNFYGNYHFGVNKTFLNIRLSSDYQINHKFSYSDKPTLNQSLSTRISYSFTLPFISESSSRTSINTYSLYDVSNSDFNSFGFSLTQRIFENLSLNLSWNKNFKTDASYSNISLNYNLPFMRFGSRAYVSEQKQNIDSYAEGSIGVDTRLKSMHFLRNKIYSGNSGSASIRCFIDENGNMSYDENEQLLRGIKVRVPQARVYSDKNTNVHLVSNLRPGYRYNILLQLGSKANPLVRPIWDDFSFIADPNTFKTIDVPYTVTGLVEGQIFYSNSDGKRKGQSGLKIHIRSKSTGKTIPVNVFSDGSYYYLGLFPGFYEIYPDETQLGILKMQADPAIREIYINFSEEGDMISGLDFELIPKKSNPGGSVSPSSE